MKKELIKTLKNEYLTHNERHTLISTPPCTTVKIWLSLRNETKGCQVFLIF